MPFRLEAAIRDRLSEKIGGINGVFGAPSSANPDLLFQPAPCLYVVFSSANRTSDNRNPAAVLAEVTWQILVAVRNLEAVNDGAAARADASAIAQSVTRAMHGWSPPGVNSMFVFEGAQSNIFSSGRQLVGLDFSIIYRI